MNNLRPSAPITKNRPSRPLNGLTLAAYGPTDAEDYLPRHTKKKIIEFVRRLFVEDEAEEVPEGKEWEVEGGAGETFEECAAPELVYKVNDQGDEENEEDVEDEDGDEDEDENEDEDGDEDKDEEDEGQGGMGSVGMVECMQQVVPTMEPEGDIFSSLDISQEEIDSYEPFADICGDCLGSMDILEESFGFDLENWK